MIDGDRDQTLQLHLSHELESLVPVVCSLRATYAQQCGPAFQEPLNATEAIA
jgi:hypothetical protein